MIENGEPAATVAASSTAPSCYRVSLLSGSLEVSARLKSADDLDLFVRVLEANKALFTKAEKLESQILADADHPAVKADRPKAKTKTNGSARKFLTEVDQSEQEILTLT
jgi:hypothetical protein